MSETRAQSFWERRDLLAAVALMVVTAGIFWPVGSYDFINYDDGGYVGNNPHVTSGLSARNVAWAFQTFAMANWHPVTWLSYMLDCQLFGVNAGASHLVNLLFHCLNVGLLFWVLKRMTGALWPSALVAALFGWHPLHVESVAWVAERKDVLSTFFWMLTMVAYVRHVEKPSASRYALALLFFALGLMTKPMLVTLPCVLLLLDFWPLGRFTPGHPGSGVESGNSTPRIGPLLREKIPFFVLSGFSAVITIVAQRGLGAMMSTQALPIKVRLGNAPLSYLNYIGKTIWPTDLALPYPYPRAFYLGTVAVIGLSLIFLSGGVVRQARERPYLLTGWFWYLVTLTPVIGVLQAGDQAMADRYTYVPLVGLFIMVVWGTGEAAARWRGRTAVLAAAAALSLLALIAATRVQLGYWKNSETLFSHSLAVTRDNPIAHFNLGFARAEKGDHGGAAEQYSKAVELRPRFADAQNNWGLALMAMGQNQAAAEHYRAAVQTEPTHALGHANLGTALSAEGKLEEAAEQLMTSLELDPSYAEAHYQLAMVLSRQDRIPDAMAHYRKAIRLRPTLVGAVNNLAWILATHPEPACRNGAEAVELAEWACRLTRGREAFLLGTLAAAYAETGKFPEAVSTAQKAEETATAAGQKEIAATNRKLLELYRAGQPYRETKQPK